MAQDRRGRWIEALCLAGAVALAPPLRFPGALPGPEVVSADDHLTVHHVFQEEAGGRVRHPALSDPATQLGPLRAAAAAALRRGEAPLWSRALYGGAPLLADAQSAPLSVGTLLHAALQADLAQDLTVSWILVWTGLGLGLWARGLLRQAGAPAGALRGLVAGGAGAAGALAPFTQVWLLHPHAAAAAWMPWQWLALQRGSPAGLALATLGLAAGGHPGTLVHGLLIGLGLLIFGAGPRSTRARLSALSGLACGLLLAGPLLLPVVEQAARSTTLAARVGQRLAPAQLLDLVWPGWWGHPAAEDAAPGLTWADGQLHPGLLVLPLAAVGLVHAPRARPIGLLWALCLVASLTSLPGPFAHGRLGSLAAALLIGPAALGLWGLVQGRARAVGLATATALAHILLGITVRHADQGSLPAEAHAPAPAPWATALAAELDRRGARVLGLGWTAQPNTGALAGLRDLRGYDLPVSVSTHRLMAALSAPPKAPWYPVEAPPPRALLQALGVGALLLPPAPPEGPDPWADAAEGLRPLPSPPAPLRALVLEDSAPEAFLASGLTRVSGPEAGLRALRAAGAWSAPPVELPLPLPEGPAPTAPVALRWTGESLVELRFEPAENDRLLVVLEAWSPGWRATVDAAPAPTLRAGGFALATLVPAGARSAMLRYRPDGWIWGQRLALIGALGLILLLVWGPTRRASGQAPS
jgi:hypothetical protein